MNLSFYLIGLLFLAIYLLFSFYVGLRSFQTCKAFFPGMKAMIFWPIYIVIAFAYLINRAEGFENGILEIIGSYWIAAFLYLFIFYVMFDLVGMAISAWHAFRPAKKRLSVWALYWKTRKPYSLVMILTAVILFAGTWAARSPVLSKYDLQIAKKVPGVQQLKLVFISDLHIEESANTAYMETAADTISALQPDLILLGGDILERTLSPGNEKKLDAVLSRLKAKQGIYAVLGNHEYYGGQEEQITAHLQEQGVKVLRDQLDEILNAQIYIAGRSDYSGGQTKTSERKPLAEMLKGTDPSKPLILLDHQPQTVAIQEAKDAGVDLMLSGHTHGGQLFPVQWITKAIYIVDRGLWQDGNLNLIVSTGLGLWGTPVRTSSRSEIVEVNVWFPQ
ncbi:metallophosphoesterase [Syntrophobotulus glycolicus DSM 8271]|uniref:Metallophosphoesterase n=1 Tax=Syntrophobotulus glycolicus (strain DSM 8271 / FlGlyR) TaxID=645991 RepID=F0SY86_SYNGF|nr:metallophosphoesterase [Syntrophobotulus glycolicus]ADY55921.1 metallophosphoesterase [Syntrophobotulus glycolicus DSM 8271]